MTLASNPPTFPIDESALNETCWNKILSSPLTILPPAFLLIATPIFSFGLPTILTLAALFTGGGFLYWTARWKTLREEARKIWIRRSNETQKLELERIALLLRYSGRHEYAVILEKMTSLKVAIERKLAKDTHDAETVESLECLVDHISTETCREITDLLELNEEIGNVILKGDRKRLAEIERSRETRHLTFLKSIKHLRTVLRELSRKWTPENDEVTPANLDHLINELGERANWMKKGNARVLDSFGTATTTAPESLSA